ncbi:recombination protein RecR [Candidatus Uhrbacteria bacterium]|nr:recombination protein RecR [Candidatus Uhrbacteria bacterium]
MPKFPQPIEDLIRELGMLPGVGPKTAERYAFALLKRGPAERARLAKAIIDSGLRLSTCSTCRNYTEADPCAVCADPRRERDLICVVATEQDLLAVEATGEYRGLYHILGGTLSPADGITPDDLTVRDLLRRSQEQRPAEIILALDPTIEGESTMLYLSRLLSPQQLKVTRLARGLPIGSELGYADEVTLTDALRGRREMAAAPKTAAPEQIKQ